MQGIQQNFRTSVVNIKISKRDYILKICLSEMRKRIFDDGRNFSF